MHTPLKVAARSSPLSQAQVREVFDPLGIPYEPHFVSTHGDLNLQQSLRDLDKSDFFTREVDALVLNGTCDVAIHSAKDLPQTLPEGLQIIALTEGQDPSDSLVLREGETLDNVHLVATSSVQREENVRKLKKEILFCDIRGPIHKRLSRLALGEVDGVVVAEAALLRLNLNPHRLRLPGSTTPLQGQLAIVARHGASFAYFKDTRVKNTLYLGLRCPNPLWHHFPIIEIVPLPFTPAQEATHYIFTSQTAVQLYRPYLTDKPIFAVGQATGRALYPYAARTASEEHAEGLITLLEKENLTGAHLVWPRSALARDTLSLWLQKNTSCTEIPLYTTRPTSLPLVDPTPFKEIIFTSPSTVSAYLALYGALPYSKELIAIGPITEKALFKKIQHEALRN